MQACNSSKLSQSWQANRVAATVAPIRTASGLCLATDGHKLITEACVARPANCSSLWNHNSSSNGIDCTDDVRHRQLWYLSAAGQLISTFAKGNWLAGTLNHWASTVSVMNASLTCVVKPWRVFCVIAMLNHGASVSSA